MSTKHFTNDPEQVVLDSLESLVWIHPSLALFKDYKAIVNKAHDPTKSVAVVSGGGAGHEPAHAEYVGNGMLAAAVSGSVFASPGVGQIVGAVRAIQPDGSRGVLLVVKNYTGDQLNFNLAAAKARALGIIAEVVTVGDDVSVGRKRSGRVGRRGLAGTVLVHKVAGAMAARPTTSIQVVRAIAQEVADSLATVGASLGHVHVPGRPTDEMLVLKQDEMELGMGIHNEPGCEVLRPVPPLPKLVERMLDQLLDTKDEDRAYVDFWESKKVVLMVNNLGGLSVLELGAIAKEVIIQLNSRGLTLVRIYTGTFMTSLDQPGFSITLLKAAEKFIECLDAPTSAGGWTVRPSDPGLKATEPASKRVYTNTELPPPKESPFTIKLDEKLFKAAVIGGCRKVIEEEPRITNYDTVAGDGDCGITLKRGAEAVMNFLQSPSFTANALATFTRISDLVEENMDGTSGALYSIFLQGYADYFREASVPGREAHVLGERAFIHGLNSALRTLQDATPARVGDRTLMDALVPFVDEMQESGDLDAAVEAARQGAERTRGMTASLGRAVYVAQKSYGEVPDPGAVGVVAFVEGLAAGLKGASGK